MPSVRIILVARDVVQTFGTLCDFQRCLRPPVDAIHAIEYDFDGVASYDVLSALIHRQMSDCLAQNPTTLLHSVGLMYRSLRPYTLQCFLADPPKSTRRHSTDDFGPFQCFVRDLSVAYGVSEIDLITCRVISRDDDRHNAITQLDLNGVKVNASTDDTGSNANADWHLEVGDVDLLTRYFDPRIEDKSILLAIVSPLVAHRGLFKLGASIASSVLLQPALSKILSFAFDAAVDQAAKAYE